MCVSVLFSSRLHVWMCCPLLSQMKNPAESFHCYQMALAQKPDHPHAYNNMGNALKDKGLVKEAVQCYTTAIRLMPRFSAAHSNLASILKEQGKIDQAIAHYMEAISSDPRFADAYRCVCALLLFLCVWNVRGEWWLLTVGCHTLPVLFRVSSCFDRTLVCLCDRSI